MSDFTASPERLIIGALLGFAVLLFLIIKVKIQPFIAIMSSALIIALVAGMPFSMITDTLAEGVGTTLQTIAILIGLVPCSERFCRCPVVWKLLQIRC